MRIPADGIIFQNFANDPEQFIIENADMGRITSINIGIDFGGNKSKTVFVATAFLNGYKELAVVADHKIDGGKGQVSPEDIYRHFIDFVKSHL